MIYSSTHQPPIRGQGEGERGGEKLYQQRNSRIHNQPGKVCRPPAEAALLQIPGVATHEEDVEHEVQAQRAKVQEGGAQTPILSLLPDAGGAVEELVGRDEFTFHEDAC